MAKDLVVVESPAKARTVGRFLGDDFTTLASIGHVRDLENKKKRGSDGVQGVSIDEKGFHPTYAVLPEKQKVISELRKASRAAQTVYLATDPDREGEAISWHLLNAAKIAPSKVKRVVFHEITKEAIDEAFNHPRELDYNLIDAYQARRILDRLVGYRLSPVLWSKVRRGLSAGRVQSVALRLIVDREREIQAFVPEEYWTIDANLAKRADSANKNPITFKAALRSLKGEKRIQIPDAERSTAITADLEGAEYAVDSVRKRETRRRPAPPFITSTMQQEASRKLRFTARRAMQVAQQLYEGLAIGDEGSVGLITYMRTDSTNVAAGALAEANGYIRAKFGADYAPKSPRVYTRKVKGAQEAHEAIRPTSILRAPDEIRRYLNHDQFRLYDLIWKRMLASQMTDAVFDSTRVDIGARSVRSDNRYEFRASGSVLKFAGFRTLYMEGDDDSAAGADEDSPPLPALSKGDALDCLAILPDQHFTQPPPRYTEPRLISALEEQGIGRPSTYASIMATIERRNYVSKERRQFVPTKLGIAVTDFLKPNFPDIMSVGFTAMMEEQLDNIAEGQRKWEPVLQDFYAPFDQSIERTMREADRVPRELIDEETDEFCEMCERPMVIKTSRYGPFMSCSGFPECKNSKPIVKRAGVDCPECGSDLLERKRRKPGGRGNRTFYGCAAYPDCEFAVNQRPIPTPCPDCGGLLVATRRPNARCVKEECGFKGPVEQREEELETAAG